MSTRAGPADAEVGRAVTAVWEAAFLAGLRRTGSVVAAAAGAGLTARGAQKRRRSVPVFATAWAATIDAWRAERAAALLAGEIAAATAPRGNHRQARIERPGPRLTPAAEERFLDMLAASANVTLAARAAGASMAGFYKKRARDDGFRARWEEAMECGLARVEMALVAAACRTFDPSGMACGDSDAIDPLIDAGPAVSIDDALRILAMGRRPDKQRKPWMPRVRTIDEVGASILWKIGNIRRMREAAAAAEAERDGARGSEED